MTPQPSERDDDSRNIAKRKQSGQSEEDLSCYRRTNRGSHLDSTTGENATSRQVKNVGGLKESGVKKKSGDYEREKARRPLFSSAYITWVRYELFDGGGRCIKL